jgi:hypothetical protein
MFEQSELPRGADGTLVMVERRATMLALSSGVALALESVVAVVLVHFRAPVPLAWSFISLGM